ncbi:MAG: PD40 domain-containing protein [Chitinophagales bacterium]|nr:PD40 domain-containing protein [Chitinophagales bacterium]
MSKIYSGKYLYIIVFTCLNLFGYSQPQIYQTGFSNQERQEVIENISKLEPLFQRDPTKEMAIQLADAFLYIKRFKKAISYYEYALEIGPLNEKEMANYFAALFEFGDLNAALSVSKEFYTKFGKMHLKAKMDSLEKLSKAKPVIVENYLAMNSKNNEYGLYPLFADYRILNSDYRPDQRDITVASKYMNPYAVSLRVEQDENSKFYTLINNDKFLYTITHFDPVDRRVYITQNTAIRFNLNNILNSGTTMKIYTAKIDALFKLGPLEEFKYNSPTHSVGHACVSNDGQTLYFVSDMPGGFGGTDIYRCMKLEDGTWGAPINLGKEVNSNGDEMFPYINPRGNTLYFSTSGNSIFGGLDLVKSSRSRANVFSKPTNLGAPFNSNKDDFAIIFTDENGEEGFFSSSRLDGLGGVDIYKFKTEGKPKSTKTNSNTDNPNRKVTTIKANTGTQEEEENNQDDSVDFSQKKKVEDNKNLAPTSSEEDNIDFRKK